MKDSNGINGLGVLFIVFLVLKLTDNIGWSWWWVTSPLWGGLVLTAFILVVYLLGKLLAKIFQKIHKY